MHWAALRWNWWLQTMVIAWLQSGLLPSRSLMLPRLSTFDYKGCKLFPNFFLTAFFMDPLDTGLHGTATISPHLNDLADNGSFPASDHLSEGKNLANFHSLCSLSQRSQMFPCLLMATNTAVDGQQILIIVCMVLLNSYIRHIQMNTAVQVSPGTAWLKSNMLRKSLWKVYSLYSLNPRTQVPPGFLTAIIATIIRLKAGDCSQPWHARDQKSDLVVLRWQKMIWNFSLWFSDSNCQRCSLPGMSGLKFPERVTASFGSGWTLSAQRALVWLRDHPLNQIGRVLQSTELIASCRWLQTTVIVCL